MIEKSLPQTKQNSISISHTQDHELSRLNDQMTELDVPYLNLAGSESGDGERIDLDIIKF